MAEKVTTMRLKVDLECSKCYKKVKKLLKKYPQIRDEKFDEKANIVTITVVCCSPEKIRDKLCCKGGGSIKSIEIVEPKPEKKPEPEKKKDVEKPKTEAAPKKEAEKPKAEPEKKKEAEKPKGEPEKKKETEKPKGEPEKKKETEKPKGGGEAPKKETEKPKEKPASVPVPVHPQAPPPMAVPVGMCIPYYDGGRPAGPCYPYGGPMVCYDGYYGRPVYDSYGGGRPCYVSRCDQYLSEENANGCTVM